MTRTRIDSGSVVRPGVRTRLAATSAALAVAVGIAGGHAQSPNPFGRPSADKPQPGTPGA